MAEPVEQQQIKTKNGIGLPVFSMLIICLFSCAFLFFQNAGEARAVDMLPFFGVFLLTALPIFLVSLAILRNVSRAATITNLTMLVVENFTLICNGIKKLIPGFHNIIFLAAVAVILILLLVLLLRKQPDLTILCGLIALGFGCVMLMNLFLALPTIISTAQNHREETPMMMHPEGPGGPGGPPDAAENTMFTGERRNVYYFIFDEYAGSENLERYYGDDNEAFLTALEDRGFSVSRTSRNTESPWTVTLIPNMLNLNYVTSDEVEILNRQEWLEDPLLYQIFARNGYQVNLINQNGFLNEKGCRVISRGEVKETISLYIYNNSIFCQIPWLKWKVEEYVLHRGQNAEYNSLMNVSEDMKNCWMETANRPTLTVGYFQCPHTPFVTDAEGNATAPDSYNDWLDKSGYLGQLHYINGVILEAVDNILTHDPDAVILLQADHGARLPGHLVNEYGGPYFDQTVEVPYMENVLCCVRTPEGNVDVEGDTCINATRKVLDAVFGLNIGTLDVPPDYVLTEEDKIGPYWAE